MMQTNQTAPSSSLEMDSFFQFGRYDATRVARFTRGFWMMVFIYLVVCLMVIQTSDLLDLMGSIILSITCLIPVYLWVRGSALGLPLFPIFALVHMPSYVFPLLSNHSMTSVYSEEERFAAALWISAAIGAGTVVWYYLVNRPIPAPKNIFLIRQSQSNQRTTDMILVFLFIGTAAFRIGLNQDALNWLVRMLPFGGFSLLRGVASAVSIITVFLGFERIGARQLSMPLVILFIGAFLLLLLDEAGGLVLAGAFSTIVPAILGYTFGRRKIPVFATVMIVCAFAFFNLGKHNMRDVYWQEDGIMAARVSISEYPTLYKNWINASLGTLFDPEGMVESQSLYSTDLESVSLVDRISMMHIFLLTFTQSPEYIPTLGGSTYKQIPKLFVPRIINPRKPPSHVGQVMLNIHYGLQSEDSTNKTFIAWGLLPEAHANFGRLGMVIFTMIFAVALGMITRFSMNVPLFSFRVLVAAIVLFQLFDVETVMSLFLTTTYQILLILGIMTLATMRPSRNPFANFSRIEPTSQSNKALPTTSQLST